MTIRRRRQRTLITAFVISVIAFILWMALLTVLRLVLRATGAAGGFWAMTEALSDAATAAGVVGAGYLAHRQLAEMASTRHTDAADRLFEELNSDENVSARRWIYQNLPVAAGEGIASVPPEGRLAIKRVLNSLDRAAFLTQQGWIPEETIMPWINPMVVKSWARLESIVDDESKRRHEPDYYEHARRLAERCMAWRAANHPDAEITWLGDAL